MVSNSSAAYELQKISSKRYTTSQRSLVFKIVCYQIFLDQVLFMKTCVIINGALCNAILAQNLEAFGRNREILIRIQSTISGIDFHKATEGGRNCSKWSDS